MELSNNFKKKFWGVTFLSLFLACSEEQLLPDSNSVQMEVSVHTLDSRAVVNGNTLDSGSRIGLTVVDETTYGAYHTVEYINMYAEAGGSGDDQTWTLQKPLALYKNKAMAIAYYPYSSTATDYTAIPVEAGETDYMYSGWVTGLNASQNVADFTLKHAMTGLGFNIRKANYDGDGVVSGLKVRTAALGTNATLSIENGSFASVTGSGEFVEIPVSGTITDSGWSYEWLAIPTGNGDWIEIVFIIDGKEYVKIVSFDEPFKQGERTEFHFMLDFDELTCTSVKVLPWTETQLEQDYAQKYSSYLTLVYNVTTTSKGTALYDDWRYTDYLSEMWVDGEMVTPSQSYAFSTTGLHEVKFKFKDEKNLRYMGFPNSVVEIVGFPSEMETLNETFQNNTSLTYIPRFPEKLRTICSNAFSGCKNVNGVYIPDGVTTIGSWAFSGCTGITEVTIPESVTCVGDGAFTKCLSIQTIEVDEDNAVYTSCNGSNILLEKSTGRLITGCNNSIVTDDCKIIGNDAFYGCKGLTGTLTIPEGVTSIGNSAFYGCSGLTGELKVPDGVARLGNNSFRGCTGITSVTLGKGLKRLEHNTFMGCTGIKGTFVVPGNIRFIDSGTYNYINSTAVVESAFEGCTGIEKVVFEEGVQTIGSHLFRNNNTLKTVVIPNSCTRIGDYVFQNNTSLEDLQLGTGLESIGTGVFYGCYNLKSNVQIPETLDTIPASLFYNCSKLASVQMGTQVTVIGNSSFRNCKSLSGGIIIPQTCIKIMNNSFEGCTGLTTVDFSDGIQTIGNRAFADCSSLEGSLVLPTSVQSVGEYVFSNCSKIDAIVLNDGLNSIGKYAFNGCKSLTGPLVLPQSVSIIGEYAFRDCTGIRTINMNEVLDTIPTGLFYGCVNLSQIDLNPNTKVIGSRVFENCISLSSMVIPESVTDIYEAAFQNCTALTAANMGPNLKSIGTAAFKGCTSIQNVSLNEGLITIGSSAFSGCTGQINQFVIPNSVTDLGISAFEGSSGIQSMTIGENVTTIPEKCFNDCTGLGSIILPEGLASIDDYAFNGTGLLSLDIPDQVVNVGTQILGNCKNLQRITIGDAMNCIPDNMLVNCISLNTIDWGNGLSNIGKNSFYGCTGLTGTLVIPNSVTSIGDYAFYGCTGLTTVDLGDAVQTIGNYAFYGCSNMKKVIFGVNLTELRNYCFYNNYKLQLIQAKAGIPPVVVNSTYNPFYNCAQGGVFIVPKGTAGQYETWVKNLFTLWALLEEE